jgi:aspartyl-tRNA(Asn)/glutamyl-tRNA(Gln) amidotransferase subunit A
LLWKDWIPTFDAPIVERLRASGAVLLGKTNTSEFGWKADSGNLVMGPTRNPWNLERTAGGSSGGAAAAVAVGLGPIAQGSDGGGSIRIPASFCGVVGFKPSFGLIPYAPPSPLPLLSHMGPLTRCVRDAALFVDATAGAHLSDRFSAPWPETRLVDSLRREPESMRIGWIDELGFGSVDEDVRRVFRSTLAVFRSLGYEVEEVVADIEDPFPALDVVWASGQAALHVDDDLDQIRASVDPGRLRLIERGRQYTGGELGAAVMRLLTAASDIRTTFRDFDVVVMPTVPTEPFGAGDDHPPGVTGSTAYLGWTPFTYMINATGQPAISLPCGVSGGGLPVGVQLVGDVGADAPVLQLAHMFERARGENLRPSRSA